MAPMGGIPWSRDWMVAFVPLDPVQAALASLQSPGMGVSIPGEPGESDQCRASFVCCCSEQLQLHRDGLWCFCWPQERCWLNSAPALIIESSIS